MAEDSYKVPRRTASNDVEFNSMVTEPTYGREEVSKAFRERTVKEEVRITVRRGEYYPAAVSKGERYKGIDNNVYEAQEDMVVYRQADQDIVIVEKQAMWELLQLYRQDLRLGNIKREQLPYCEHHINLCSDLIMEGYPQAAMVCLSRAASVLELSQSIDGFLRGKHVSIVSEQSIKQTESQPKRGIFGFGKKKEGA